jgi:hypothetical protein
VFQIPLGEAVGDPQNFHRSHQAKELPDFHPARNQGQNFIDVALETIAALNQQPDLYGDCRGDVDDSGAADADTDTPSESQLRGQAFTLLDSLVNKPMGGQPPRKPIGQPRNRRVTQKPSAGQAAEKPAQEAAPEAAPDPAQEPARQPVGAARIVAGSQQEEGSC